MSNYSPQMTEQMDSKWRHLATASTLGQAPRFLLLLFLIAGLSHVTSNHGAQFAVDPNQRYLGEALSEMAANIGYDLRLASDHWAEVPVSAIAKDGSIQERLEMLLGGMNYVLELNGRKRIVVYILSDAPPERIAGFGPDQPADEFPKTSVTHRDGEDFLKSTTSDGIQELVKIGLSLEIMRQKEGQWVLMDGPNGLEEEIWIHDEQKLESTLEHSYTSDGIEEWVSANKVEDSKQPLHRVFTSEGTEELISVRKPTRNEQGNEGKWVTTFDPDGIEERFLSQ